ncbi:MAG: DedA family protein, partial [bacterium]|nr:DedA family protein [bacterium]
IVRTFAPILAGVGKMHYGEFITYNLIGGALWAIGLPLIGYYLGSVIPGIDQYLLPIIVGIILVSVMPIVLHIVKDPAHRANLIKAIRRALHRNS